MRAAAHCHYHRLVLLSYLSATAAWTLPIFSHCSVCRLAGIHALHVDVDDDEIAASRRDSSMLCAAWEGDAAAPF